MKKHTVLIFMIPLSLSLLVVVVVGVEVLMVCVGIVMPAVLDHSGRDIEPVSSRQRQLLHPGAAEHNVAVC